MDEEEPDFWSLHCEVFDPEVERLVIVGVLGAAISIVSLVFNTFLFFVLLSNRRHRHSQFLYLIFLAFADIFISVAYLLLFPTLIYIDYFKWEWLAYAWFSYMRITITTSHLFISFSAFIIVAAAFERYLSIYKSSVRFSQKKRLIVLLITFIFASIAKLPVYFEQEVIRNHNCTGPYTYTAVPTELSETDPYKTAYKFWYRNVTTIFLPFIILFCLNIGIIVRLRQQQVGAKLFRFATSEHRQNIRSITLLLVSVTFSYLASNLLNVILYTWELIDKESLLDIEHRQYYTISTDLVSVFTVLSSACRLPIYFICNARIRLEILARLGRFCFILPFKESLSDSQKRYSTATTVRYCNTGNGFMICETGRNVGTAIDRVVLTVAVGKFGIESQINDAEGV
ncbi:hypothetical protein WR25_12785 [Diploscapter pachys]|uniref:G-protein coupled receptors family 1 profile domain-containing protein n=1 Tax=Diploscapter pachys TaxID=2018661 RepID=A0A2A2LGS1_9BILA|nr:hypothetical protein WR25_12785 [Diploscapter pachys]